MSEHDEVKLRRFIKVWENRQSFAGTLLVFAIFPAVGVLLAFFANPSKNLCIVLLGSLLYFCHRLLTAAGRVVELKQHLSAMRRELAMPRDFIEAEIVNLTPVAPFSNDRGMLIDH